MEIEGLNREFAVRRRKLCEQLADSERFMVYASWRKCDFQVHTPRDPNWEGKRPVGIGETQATGAEATEGDVDAERSQWAIEFIDQCIAKGLKAVAITDHHETVLASYVQRAIAERKKNDVDFDLWLFPGMELTAKGGKQCLIIFDADLPEEWQQQAQGALGIAHAGVDKKAAKSLGVNQLTKDYPDLAEALDALEDLRGRYIILPNVSRRGQHTVLVKGGHGDFSRMPYVGGYLDQCKTINDLNWTDQQRLSGNCETWSKREIYPLSTSDSRSADRATLGENNTWIKLAEPTAEAIRQAFLAHRSRICIGPPCIPSLFVAELDVEDSTILRHTNLLLSPELNATIGGRGSGKSSLLEYLAFGLGRSCYDMPRSHYSGTKRLHELVEHTLISNSGTVRLEIIHDGARFQIERKSENSYEPQITTYSNGKIETVSVKELRSLFPAVVYSQGELSEIGKQDSKKTQLTDLLQFVDPECKREDDRLANDIETAKEEVKKTIRRLTSHWDLQFQLRQWKTNRNSLTQRAQSLEKTLPEQSEGDRDILDHYEKADDFNPKRIQASKHADQILRELKTSADDLLNKRDLTSELTGNACADKFKKAYDALYQAFSEGIQKLQDDLEAKRRTLTCAEASWDSAFGKARKDRDAVLEKLSEHKTVTAQIKKLREEITHVANQIGDLEAKATDDPSETLEKVIEALRVANRRRTERTESWALEIEKLSNNRIKAKVNPDGDMSEFADAMKMLASQTGSQEATRNKGIEEALSGASATDAMDRLRKDALSLLCWKQVGASPGEKPKCTDLMKILGETENIRQALTNHIDVTRVEAISTAVLKPEIALSYCDGDQEIFFEKASDGQRAAALLFILLKQPGGPLIIDQPEGDLDNKIITELTKELHSAKQKRQLIFAGHNANIVVNGSSELVIHLDVDGSGMRKVTCNGAIDKPEICEVITATMEGGEKAFKDRQDKYGY